MLNLPAAGEEHKTRTKNFFAKVISLSVPIIKKLFYKTFIS
jgi:hypothetical protein